MRATDAMPHFLLLATDKIAPWALRAYAGRLHVEVCGPGVHKTDECPLVAVQRALETADKMERWPVRTLPVVTDARMKGDAR